jgi:hypothetical protein
MSFPQRRVSQYCLGVRVKQWKIKNRAKQIEVFFKIRQRRQEKVTSETLATAGKKSYAVKYARNVRRKSLASRGRQRVIKLFDFFLIQFLDFFLYFCYQLFFGWQVQLIFTGNNRFIVFRQSNFNH